MSSEEPSSKKMRIEDSRGCTIHKSEDSVIKNAFVTWNMLMKSRKANKMSDRVEKMNRHLDTKYGCISGLSKALRPMLEEAYSSEEVPKKTMYIDRIIDLIRHKILTKGIYHQCRRRSDPDQSSRTKLLDNKSTLLRQYIKARLMDSNNKTVDTSSRAGFTELGNVLKQMRFGRFDKAIDNVAAHWSYKDCQIIMDHGLEVFQEQRMDPNKGISAFAFHLGHLIDNRIHERFLDDLGADSSDMQSLLPMISADGSSSDLSSTLMEFSAWQEGHYEP
ncbi:hypothetical protein BGX20_000478, partial [Mortierella sp. AD010]